MISDSKKNRQSFSLRKFVSILNKYINPHNSVDICIHSKNASTAEKKQCNPSWDLYID